MKEFKKTLLFVFFIATPLCIVNNLIFNPENWLKAFLLSYAVSVPQAILYVSVIKWVTKINEKADTFLKSQKNDRK